MGERQRLRHWLYARAFSSTNDRGSVVWLSGTDRLDFCLLLVNQVKIFATCSTDSVKVDVYESGLRIIGTGKQTIPIPFRGLTQ